MYLALGHKEEAGVDLPHTLSKAKLTHTLDPSIYWTVKKLRKLHDDTRYDFFEGKRIPYGDEDQIAKHLKKKAMQSTVAQKRTPEDEKQMKEIEDDAALAPSGPGFGFMGDPSK